MLNDSLQKNKEGAQKTLEKESKSSEPPTNKIKGEKAG